MASLSSIISNFCQQYINKIDKKQASFDIASGLFKMQNFSFKKDLFSNFGIPLVINNSLIGNAIIDLSIISAKPAAFLQLNNVDIYSSVNWKTSNENIQDKINKLVQSFEDKKEWYGWFEKIIDNSRIEITNIRFHIEFDGPDNTKNSITFYLESLEMNTLNSNNKTLFFQKPEILIKKINLTNFSIAFYTNIKEIQNFDELKGMKYNLLENGSFSLTLKNDHRKETSFFNFFNTVFNSININLNEQQYLALKYLFNEYLRSKLYQKFNISQKITPENKTNWSYFNYCALKKKFQYSFSPNFAIKFCQMRKKFSQKFRTTLKLGFTKNFINKSLDKNGKDLTYSLLLYSSIFIQLQKNEKKSIIDLLLLSKNPVDFQIKFPQININFENLFSLTVDKIDLSLKQQNKEYCLNLTTHDLLITDLLSKNSIFQTVKNDQNFINFEYNFNSEIKKLNICKFKVNINNSFIKKFCQTFFDDQENMNENTLNQCIMILNPLLYQKLTIESEGFIIDYIIDKTIISHSFYCDINKFYLQNITENSINDNPLFDIFSKIECKQIRFDESIISEKFSIECSKKGIVNQFNVSISDAQFNIDSKIIDIASNIVSSIISNININIDLKNIYSLNSVLVNCSSISFNINMDNDNFVFSISNIKVNPYVEFNNIVIQNYNKNQIIKIPTLSFKEWPIISTEIFEVKVNSIDFIHYHDEIIWITNQINKLTKCIIYDQNKVIDKSNIQIKSKEIDFVIDDKKELIKLHNISFIFDENFVAKIGSFDLFNSIDEKVVFCDEEIQITNEMIKSIYINIPNLRINIKFDEFNKVIHNIFSNEKQSKYKNENLNQICISIPKLSVNFDESAVIETEKLTIKYLISENPKLIFELPVFNINDMITINDLNLQTNDFVFDISISSMNLNLDDQKYKTYKYFSQILNHQEKQIDFNINITKFNIVESINKLNIKLRNIKYSHNSSQSIGAIQIQSVKIENLIVNNINIFLIYNSIDFNDNENIETIFSLEKKKMIKPIKLNLTKIKTNIESIEIEYIQEFITRLFNFYKNNEKIFGVKCPISININKAHIKNDNIQNEIELSTLILDKNEEMTEIKCNSIFLNKCIEDRVLEKEEKSFNLIIRKTLLDTSISINQINFYLGNDLIQILTNIYDSMKKINSSVIINMKDIQTHFQFQKNHDLVIKFDSVIDIKNNVSKMLNITNLSVFFNNYQIGTQFLPLIQNFSFLLNFENDKDKSFDYSLLEVETGDFNINVSVIDILELQMVFENVKHLLQSFFNEKINSFIEERKKCLFPFSVKESKITIKPITISLCEENRDSNLYYPIITIFVQCKSLNLVIFKKEKRFSMNLTISIKNINFLNGKPEILMHPTSFSIAYSDESNISFGISNSVPIDFNLTQSSFLALLRFVDKFKMKDQVLLLNNESKSNYKPEYIIQNNLNKPIEFKYIGNLTKREINYHILQGEEYPLPEFNDYTNITFNYNNINESFYPNNIIFPTYYNKISVSIAYKNHVKIIQFNPPLSIQNKLDFPLFIYTFDSNKKPILCCELKPKFKYPFTRNYYWFSDYEIDHNNNNSPVLFNMKECPNSIKIERKETHQFITFNVNVKYDHRSNTKVYQIIPSFVIKNLLPIPISFNLYISKNEKVNNNPIYLGMQEKTQINSFNHDIKSFYFSLRLSTVSFEKLKLIELNNEEDIQVLASSENTALKIQKTSKINQRKIDIFAPCIIFNRTNENNPIKFSNENNTKFKIVQNSLALYGLKSYEEKTMELDISIKNHKKIQKAIDCMKFNSNCLTLYLPKKDFPNLFYPLNCSITLGDFPMNETRVVTFTDFLHIVNKLPFDFTLFPVTSNKALSKNINYKDYKNILDEINGGPSFNIHQNSVENSNLINTISKNATFIFSSQKFSNKPILQLNSITRTVFLLKNGEELFYVELNIYEEKSTFYACFQVPVLPAPLSITNSLKIPLFVHQNIEIEQNIIKIEPESTSLFAFNEPFINNKQLYFEMENDKNENKHFLFSFEEQLSPLVSLENNFIISTSFINKNSVLINVKHLNEPPVIQKIFNVFFSINCIHLSLRDEQKEIMLFTMNDIHARLSTNQDNESVFFHFSINSIQIDNQNQVCLVGAKENLIKNSSKNKSFLDCFSIFPRGVPIFTVINFLSFQIKPIYIILDTSLIMKLYSFYNKISNSKLLSNSLTIQPSFNSINVNKTLISYFEISSINIIIQNPHKNDKLFSRIMNLISSNSNISISIPKFFAYEFNNNLFYFSKILGNFYGHEFMKQISKNQLIKMMIKMIFHLFFNYNEIKFNQLAPIQNDLIDSCDNQILLFNYFNEIELKNLSDRIESFFIEIPDVISQLIARNANCLSIANQRKSRFVIGIKNDNISLNNVDLFKLFDRHNIKRVQNSMVSMIYSSLDEDEKNVSIKNSILSKIQCEVFKIDKKGQIRFIINSNNLLFCVNDNKIFVFSAQIAFIKFVSIFEINSIELDESKVSLLTKNESIGQIDIHFINEEIAKIFISFINSQMKMNEIFGNSFP